MLRTAAQIIRDRFFHARSRRRRRLWSYPAENLESRLLLTDLFTPPPESFPDDVDELFSAAGDSWVTLTQAENLIPFHPDNIWWQLVVVEAQTAVQTLSGLDPNDVYQNLLDQNPVNVQTFLTNPGQFMDPQGNIYPFGNSFGDFSTGALTDPFEDAAIGAGIDFATATFDEMVQAIDSASATIDWLSEGLEGPGIIAGIVLVGAVGFESNVAPGAISDVFADANDAIDAVFNSGVPDIDLPDLELGSLTVESSILFLSGPQVVALSTNGTLQLPDGQSSVTLGITPIGFPAIENLQINAGLSTGISPGGSLPDLTLGTSVGLGAADGTWTNPLFTLNGGVPLGSNGNLQVVGVIDSGSGGNGVYLLVVVNPSILPFTPPWSN